MAKRRNRVRTRKRKKRLKYYIIGAASALLMCIIIGAFLYVFMAKYKVDYYQKRIQRYEAMQRRIVLTLSNAQLANGAFADYPATNGTVHITPRDACYTVMAILRSNIDGSIETARRYFDWHFSKMNTADEDICGLTGTVYDYEAILSDGQLIYEQSTNSYDTADASAALLLTALATYAEYTGDVSYLLSHVQEILLTLEVLDALTTEKLSIGRPDAPRYSLKDNTEVIQGYWAGAYMLEKLLAAGGLDVATQNQLSLALEDARDSWTTMEGMLKTKLYVTRQGHYHASVNIDVEGLSFGNFSWETFYPDAVVQLFPTITGVSDARSRKSKALYRKFCASWDWQDLDFLSEYTEDYCGYLAYCAALRGDIARLDDYFNQLESRGILTDAAYPKHNSDTAWLALACQQHIVWMNAEIVRWDPLNLYAGWSLDYEQEGFAWSDFISFEWIDAIWDENGTRPFDFSG